MIRAFKKKVFFAIFVFVFCGIGFSKPAAPNWVKDFNSAYGRDYIGYVSTASSRDEAREKSLDLLANYFDASIQSQTNSSSLMIEESRGEEKSWYKKNVISRNIGVKSDVEIFGIEYEFYFDAKKQTHYCAAFINKVNATKLIFQRMSKSKKSFLGYYNLAVEREKQNPFSAVRYYAKASAFAKEYISLSEYLALLSPNTEIAENDSEKMLGIDAKVSRLAAQTIIGISADGEINNAIETTIRDIFANEGFALKKRGENEKYSMSIKIEKNIVSDGEVFTATPSISIEIFGGEEILFVYGKTFERSKAFNERTLEKQIETKILDELKNSLMREFYENI
ncbi:MAG: hypothetical protein HDR35_09720 [Treponema sp.]|nr:hypothetical protein [Treponema sp.]